MDLREEAGRVLKRRRRSGRKVREGLVPREINEKLEPLPIN